MAITQLNLYSTTQNLSSMANNIDYNRIGVDKTDITVNHGTSPWTFTIKQGSIIEKDGNLYVIDTADYTLQATSNTHNYIVFTGSAFASSASLGTYDPLKGGYYYAGNRVLKYYIDYTNNLEYTMAEFNNRAENLRVENNLIVGGDITGNYNTWANADTLVINETVASAGFASISKTLTLKKPVNLLVALSGTGFFNLSVMIGAYTYYSYAAHGSYGITLNPGVYSFTASCNNSTATMVVYIHSVYGHNTTNAAEVFTVA